MCLENWTYFFRAVALFSIFILGLYVLFSRVLANVSGFKLSPTGAELEFKSQEKSISFETVLVHPTGWVDSGISLKKGDEVILSASGNVNIAFGSMVKASLIEGEAKKSLREAKKSLGDQNIKFTAEEIENSKYSFPWSTPSGIDPSLLKRKSTKSIRINPNAYLGQLLAVVCPGSACGSKEIPQQPNNAAQIESYSHDEGGFQFTAKENGHLRFIINDVTDDDRDKNQLGWQDNIGFFSVNLKIVRKSEN